MKNETKTTCLVCGLALPCKHGPQGFRGVEETRSLPVRGLTAEECNSLLVHSHDCTRERQRAYLLISAEDHPEVYFDAVQQVEIQNWIRNEPTLECPNCHAHYYGCRTSHHCDFRARGPERPRALTRKQLEEQRADLLAACEALLEAYAPRASETAANHGEAWLHSSVRKARAAIAKARKGKDFVRKP